MYNLEKIYTLARAKHKGQRKKSFFVIIQSIGAK